MDAAVRAVLQRLEARDSHERQTGAPRAVRLRQVTPEVGRFLHTLVLACRPRHIIEAGTSGGYSAIWMGTAARTVGASVTTLEIDPAKVSLARANIQEAGLEGVVTVVHSDALAYLRERRESFDFIFLDAEKEDYLAFYELAVPLLPAGGVLVADNLTSHEQELAPFRQRVMEDPRVSAIVVPIGRGELLAVKI